MAVHEVPEEPIGRRIARLRTTAGWSQVDLAQRLAMSRTAVSHLEAAMSRPSERTVILLAGLFGLEPPDLVAGTDYPPAQAERLPLTAPRHTHVDRELACFAAQWELRPLLDPSSAHRLAETWEPRLRALFARSHDLDERARLQAALRSVRDGAALPN
jgi:transcriptional regulator with XRE-family HTH domain